MAIPTNLTPEEDMRRLVDEARSDNSSSDKKRNDILEAVEIIKSMLDQMPPDSRVQLSVEIDGILNDSVQEERKVLRLNRPRGSFY